MINSTKGNIVKLENAVNLYDLQKTYDDSVEFITTTETFPMVTEIRYEGKLNKAIKSKVIPKGIKQKVDTLIQHYGDKLKRKWFVAKEDLINQLTSVEKMEKGGPGSGRHPEDSSIEYHGTSPENAKRILQEGFKVGPGQAGVSTTQGYEEALEYANGNPEGVIEVHVEPNAPMAGKEGKDFLTGTGSFHPRYLKPLRIASLKKADEEPDSDKEKKKKIIEEILAGLAVSLGSTALDVYKQAYMLGKERGVSISGQDFSRVISEEDNQKLLDLVDKNQDYINNFIQDLKQKYSDAIDREYESQQAEEHELASIMSSSESRLGLYATAALGALGIGFTAGLDEANDQTDENESEVTGIIWVTNHDDLVCPGCADNDGKFFTFDEFEEEYQNNECLTKCRCAETSVPTTAPAEHFGKSLKFSKLQKGGQGSGCQGPNCGRPETGNKDFKYRTKFGTAFNYNEKDPVSTTSTRTKEPVDKFVVTDDNEFIPVSHDELHGIALANNDVKNFDSTTRVIQDLPRKVAFFRIGYPDTKVLNSAIIDGDEKSMNMIINRQKEIAEKLYGGHKGMKVILASGGLPRVHGNNLPRDIDNGSEIPKNPEAYVDKRFTYKV